MNTVWFVVFPSPSSPLRLVPAFHTNPSLSTIPECIPSPAANSSIILELFDSFISFGVFADATEPSPILPVALLPITYSLPLSVIYIVIWFPADISITFVASAVTVLVPVVVPISPYEFVPHPYKTPLEDNAKLCAVPHEILAISFSPDTAVALLARVYTFPSSPKRRFPDMSTILLFIMNCIGRDWYPSPHVYTFPSFPNAILIFLYASIFLIFFSPPTFIGVVTFVVVPFPTWPFAL